MFKKKSILFVIVCDFLAFQGVNAKDNSQDGSCQGHPTCEQGDK